MLFCATCSDGAKRQKRDDGGDAGGQGGVNGGGETSRKVSKRGAGRAMLEALKPSPLEVVFSLNGLNVDGAFCCLSVRFGWYRLGCHFHAEDCSYRTAVRLVVC